MKSYFVVFKRQKGQVTDSYSVLNEAQLEKAKDHSWPIKWTKEIQTKEIYTKEELRSFMHELGGTWYENN